MANGNYSYNGEVISEEQLAGIAGRRGLTLKQLLEVEPEIKTTIKPLSQQELVEARFSFDGTEYDLGDISKTAEHYDLSVEDFLIKHKDKITTTSRIGSFLGLSDPDFLKGSKRSREEILKKFEYDDEKEDDKKIDFAPLFLAPAGTTGVSTSANFERLSIEGEAVDNFISNENLEELNSTFSDENITFKRFKAGKKRGTKGNIIVKLPWLDSSRAFPIPKEDEGLRRLKFNMASYIASNPSDKVAGISKHLSDEIDAIWDEHSMKWDAEDLMKDDLGTLLGGDYEVETSGTLGNEFYVKRLDDDSKINIKVGGSEKVGWANTPDELKKFLLTKTYNYEDTPGYKEDKNKITELVRDHYLKDPVTLNDIFETTGITDFHFRATAKNKEVLIDVVMSDIADGEGAWLNNARSNFDNLTAWDIDQIVRGIISGDVYNDWRALAGKWSDKEIDEQISMLTTTKGYSHSTAGNEMHNTFVEQHTANFNNYETPITAKLLKIDAETIGIEEDEWDKDKIETLNDELALLVQDYQKTANYDVIFDMRTKGLAPGIADPKSPHINITDDVFETMGNYAGFSREKLRVEFINTAAALKEWEDITRNLTRKISAFGGLAKQKGVKEGDPITFPFRAYGHGGNMGQLMSKEFQHDEWDVLIEQKIELVKKMEALKRTYLLNERLETIDKSDWGGRWEQAARSFTTYILEDENTAIINHGMTEAQTVAATKDLYHEMNIPLSRAAKEHSKTNTGDMIMQGVGGLPWVVGEFYGWGKLVNAGKYLVGINKWVQALGKERFIRNNVVLSEKIVTKEANRWASRQYGINTAKLSQAEIIGLYMAEGTGFRIGAKVPKGIQLVGPTLFNRGIITGVGMLSEGLVFSGVEGSWEGMPKGMGFSLIGQGFPASLKTTATYLNTLYKLSAGGVKMAGGNQVGTAFNGLVNDLMGHEDWQVFLKNNYDDPDAWLGGVITDLVLGAGLATTHMNVLDFQSHARIKKGMGEFKKNRKKYEEVDKYGKPKVKKGGEENWNKWNDLYKRSERRVWENEGMEDFLNPVKLAALAYKETEAAEPDYIANGYNGVDLILRKPDKGEREGEFRINKQTNRVEIRMDPESITPGLLSHELHHPLFMMLMADKPTKAATIKTLLDVTKTIFSGGKSLYNAIKESGVEASAIEGMDLAKVREAELFAFISTWLRNGAHLEGIKSSNGWWALKKWIQGDTKAIVDNRAMNDIINWFGNYHENIGEGKSNLTHFTKLAELIENMESGAEPGAYPQVGEFYPTSPLIEGPEFSKGGYVEFRRYVSNVPMGSERLIDGKGKSIEIRISEEEEEDFNTELQKVVSKPISARDIKEIEKLKDLDLNREKYPDDESFNKAKEQVENRIVTLEAGADVYKVVEMYDPSLGKKTAGTGRIINKMASRSQTPGWNVIKDDVLRNFLTSHRGIKGLTADYNRKVREGDINPKTFSLGNFIGGKFDVRFQGIVEKLQTKEFGKPTEVETTPELVAPIDLMLERLDVMDLSPKAQMERKRWLEDRGLTEETAESYIAEKNLITLSKALGLKDAKNIVKKAQKTIPELERNMDPQRPEETKKEYNKRIVSHKNAVNQYRKSIEKDIVVGFFGVSENTYNKMSVVGKEGQAYKTAMAWQIKGTEKKPGDLQAVKKVIETKNKDGNYKNVPTILTAISKGHQHKIDPIDLTEVAPDIVKGKSAGVPNVLLWNELLFTPTSKRQQTESGLEPFTQSESFIEYQKSTDPIYRAEFEQKFVESLKTPQDYKAVMQEVGKNIYLQSVRVALPTTSALARQLEAGKNEGLASTKLLYKEIIEDLKNKGVPTLGDLHTILYFDSKYKEWPVEIRDEVIDKHAEDFDRITKGVKEESAELAKEGKYKDLMLGGTTPPEIKMSVVETKNNKAMIAHLQKFKLYEGAETYGVDTPTSNAKFKAAYNKWQMAMWQQYPHSGELDANGLVIETKDSRIRAILLKDASNGSNKNYNFFREKYELIKYKKDDKFTIQNWADHNLGRETYRSNGEHIDIGKINPETGLFEYKYWMLRDSHVADAGETKTEIHKNNLVGEQENYSKPKKLKINRQIIWDKVTRKENATHEEYMHVLKANAAKRRFWIDSMVRTVENHEILGLTRQEAVQCMLFHIRRHTNINSGSLKGTSTIVGATIETGPPIGKKPESPTFQGTALWAEHLFMAQNYSSNMHTILGRNWDPRGEVLLRWAKDSRTKGTFNHKKLNAELDLIDPIYEQVLPLEYDQSMYDRIGLNTEFMPEFRNEDLGRVHSFLNILWRAGMAENFSDAKSKKVRSIEEGIIEDYNQRQVGLILEVALENKQGVGDGKLTALQISLSQKNTLEARKIEAQNKKGIENITGKDKLGSERIDRVMKIMDKALAEGRKKNKKKKSGSFFDADDTLFRSKSGVRYTLPNPSGKPQPSRKVIFMAGGPGSGKSSVIKGLGLEKQGFKIVNQDISLQWLAKNHGLPTDMRDFTKEQASKWSSLGWEARTIAKHKQSKFQGKGDGIIVDGTGASLKMMEKQVQEFTDKGYDVQMIFVETSLETSQARNLARPERSLRTGIVIKTWESVQGNKKAYKKLFGERFAEVNTNNLKMKDAMPPKLIKKLDEFTKGYIKGRLNPGEYANRGSKLKEQGAEFDFTEFDKIVEGETGFLFPKALAKAKKYGNKDMFIITARPPKAAKPIHEFLKSQGLDIPLENIYALGNSTPEAKAFKIVEKIAEGYNDIYFADDALQNIKAVKNVMDQFDVKGRVQQSLGSTKITDDINKIMEHSLGVVARKRFTKAEAHARGKDIKRRRIIMPDANADLELLIEPLYGKGKEGIENKKWFEKNFYKPWERGINDLNTARQTILNDYKNLRKQNKDIVKSFDKAVEGTNFTNDQAMRVYIWNKNGFEIPGLAKTTEAKLVRYIKNNPELQSFADNVTVLTKIETGLRKPGTAWMAQTLASEVSKTGRTIDRQKYLAEWIETKNIVFSKENLNKMESRLGTRWRGNIEDMFNRMETGRTRSLKMTETGNQIMDYLNGAVGATMSLNMRSGILQSISSVNFLNFSDNNIFMAGKAFANQLQYWKDFVYILNSDMLVQRREGLKININEAELAAVVAEGKNKYQRALAWTLKQGFLPTKIVDSFAIAAGGATFLRNRINTYTKEGFSKKEAESKAWLDFQSTAEKTQQSSRPDLLSTQQTSFEGRLILPFANTPIQMNRIMLKEILNISKGRYDGYFGEGSLTHKLSKITYYGAAQSIIFATLQSGLFALMYHGTKDDDFDYAIANKKLRTVNTVTDSFLRGMGVQAAVLAGFKNAVLEFLHQQKKGKRADYNEVVEDLLNISPTVGSKYSLLDAAGNTYLWNQKEIHEKGFSLDNTKGIEATAQTVQAILNWPTYRAVRKTENVQGALDEQNAAWQRFWMFGGWSSWDIGVERKKKKKRKRKPGKVYKRKVYKR